MQPSAKPSLGDFVKIDASYVPSYPEGSICEIVSLHSSGSFTVKCLDAKTLAIGNLSPSFAPHVDACTLLNREEAADVYERRAQLMDSEIPKLQLQADKFRRKASILRKYKNPKTEIAAEFLELSKSAPSDKKAALIRQALEGRVKDNLI